MQFLDVIVLHTEVRAIGTGLSELLVISRIATTGMAVALKQGY
jgi:hypothetical protein